MGKKSFVSYFILVLKQVILFRFQITLNSTGITYSAISLLTTLFALYFSFVANKFRLDWKIGISCLIFYLLFLIFASLVEMNVFFAVNIPTCDHKYVWKWKRVNCNVSEGNNKKKLCNHHSTDNLNLETVLFHKCDKKVKPFVFQSLSSMIA